MRFAVFSPVLFFFVVGEVNILSFTHHGLQALRLQMKRLRLFFQKIGEIVYRMQ